jgi:peptidoglycan/LPS O-acetylase OafA/YrhL
MLAQGYRKDIDGLRAIAVLSVIFFHFGYFPNGYLGVDVFFVISGYLITKIIFSEISESRFSIIQFYLRRTRRIIPLVLFVNIIALIIGIFVMLPDDLENLGQSIFATNLFSNNILQFLTTRNYWDVANEFKPLMHTWSLGIEEQFYLVYPFIFLIIGQKRVKWILPILFLVTAVSLLLFLSSSDEPSKFYLIPFRFFELSIGGLGAIIFKDKLLSSKFSLPLLVSLLLILLLGNTLPSSIKLCATVLTTIGILTSTNSQDKICAAFLENKVMTVIGKISFSLYMWHQLVLAFTRYFIVQEYSKIEAGLMFILITLLSFGSYYLIEKPFRDKKRTSVFSLLITVGIAFILSTGVSLYLHLHSGVIYDVPELGITKNNIQKNMHAIYNDKVYKLSKDFSNDSKTKVLVVGNSFARDWVNVLSESKYKNDIEVRYVYDIDICDNRSEKLSQAKYIFFSDITKSSFDTIAGKYAIDASKVWVIGTKNFGVNNGLFFNRKGNQNYCTQRTIMPKMYYERNMLLKKQWGDRYIDIIEQVVDGNGKMPVFTPECTFISQDCTHFTESGAVYFAHLMENNWVFKFAPQDTLHK